MKISRHKKKLPISHQNQKLIQHTAQLARQTIVSFFSGRNQNFPPLQKNANFPPEPKTDTTAQPARQTTVSFFFSGRNRQNRAPIRQTTVSFFSGRNEFFFSGRNENFPPQQKNCQFRCTKIHTSASGS